VRHWSQGKALGSFFASTAGRFTTEVGRSWEEEIVKRRPEAAVVDDKK